jgi:osmotically-inducible protein OsmY
MDFPKIFAITGLAAMLVAPTAATRSYAGQTSTKTTVAVDDSTLKTRVETAVKAQPTLKNQDVDVEVTDKVVTLTGEVQTEQLKLRAGRTAHVAGVTRVDNQLKVDPKAGRSLEDKTVDATKSVAHKTSEVAKTVGEKTKDGAVATGGVAKTVGEKTKDGAVATGEVATDAWINTRIHSKMVDEDTLKGSDVSVDVKDHVVTLKGTVMSAAGKARAEAIARSTEGVKSVNNLLTIGPKS